MAKNCTGVIALSFGVRKRREPQTNWKSSFVKFDMSWDYVNGSTRDRNKDILPVVIYTVKTVPNHGWEQEFIQNIGFNIVTVSGIVVYGSEANIYRAYLNIQDSDCTSFYKTAYGRSSITKHSTQPVLSHPNSCRFRFQNERHKIAVPQIML